MKSWKQTSITVITVAIGLVLALWLGLHLYIAATSTPLHPDPKGVPSVTRAAAAQTWAGAVAQAEQIVRAGVSEQNLPGLSIAVGAGGELRCGRRELRLGGSGEGGQRSRRTPDSGSDTPRLP